MSNRRAQKSKPAKSKFTTAYKPEKRIKGSGPSRNPKHRNQGWAE